MILIDYSTESHAADIETLTDSMANEREEREMVFNSVMTEREALSRNLTQLTLQIQEITHRIDGSDANISSKLPLFKKTSLLTSSSAPTC